jgi:decaprenyl-phosphate phosphoribosyltransferase
VSARSGAALASTRAGRLANAALGVLLSCRPKQWTKNALVFAAPMAAGSILLWPVLRATLLTLVAFVLASSSTYLLNDVLDRHRDALHPTKRYRPIAAGIVPVPAALVASLLLGASSILLALTELDLATVAVLTSYVALTLAYSLRLKHEPVLDIGVVAAGFVLRAVAGGLAAHVFISHYFLLVAGFGALFLVASKRYAELNRQSADAQATRRVLATYSPGFLNLTRTLAATTTVVTYCFWAFERATQLHDGRLLLGLSIAPFTLAVLRYALLVEHGHGEAPEDLLLEDRAMLALGGLWFLLVAGSILVA